VRFSIDIEYPLEEMEASRRRLEAWTRFAYVDRVPIMYCLEPRYFTPLFGLDYQEFFRDVETQFELQLRFAKHRIEKIPEDFCQSTDIVVYPYFDNVITASAFGAEIHYPDNETLQAVPYMKSPEDIDRLAVPEPDAGLWGTIRRWWTRMRELGEETELTFNGKSRGRVVVAPLTDARLGPHMVAVDLAGENFYLWMAERPEKAHQLLGKITAGMVQAEDTFRRIDPRPRGGFGLAEDSIQICSPAMYEEFCVPYDDMLYQRYGAGFANGRGMHMCGDSRHLLDSLVHKGRISSFNVFGYPVPPKTAAAVMGGKVRLWGNINPMLLLNGTAGDVAEAARTALEAMAGRGGYMLGDGANVCPGTPLESFQALMKAAEDFGLPDREDSRLPESTAPRPSWPPKRP